MIIKKPGVYELDDSDYFADPCPKPSLTQSHAKIILDQSPMHAAWAHPRLNPKFKSDDDTKYDLGSVAHALLLGRGRRVCVIDADDWRTEKSRLEREKILARGEMPCLRKHMTTALAMRHTLEETLQFCELRLTSPQIKTEQAVIWHEGGKQISKRRIAGETWLRTKIDAIYWGPPITVYDYKTTKAGCNDFELGKRIYNLGWDIQAAMHNRGLVNLHPLAAGMIRHIYIAQETDPPYAVNVVQMPESFMTSGRIRLTRAIEKWKRCIENNDWPGFCRAAHPVFMPPWAVRELEQGGYDVTELATQVE